MTRPQATILLVVMALACLALALVMGSWLFVGMLVGCAFGAIVVDGVTL